MGLRDRGGRARAGSMELLKTGRARVYKVTSLAGYTLSLDRQNHVRYKLSVPYQY